MKQSSKYVGLDVHKATIAVAVAETERAKCATLPVCPLGVSVVASLHQSRARFTLEQYRVP